MTEAHLSAAQIARIFRTPGLRAIYASRVNGAIVLDDVRRWGSVHVGNFDHRSDVAEIEDAAHRALLGSGK